MTAVHEAPSENDGKLRAPGMDNGIVVRKQVIVETMRDGEGPDEVVVAMGGTHTRRSSAGTDQRPLTNNAAAKGEGW